MLSLKKKSLRLFVLAILLFVIAGTTYAFADTNTIVGGEIKMGEGYAAISGYEVTVDYTVSLADPSLITAVDLSLASGGSPATATEVHVSFDPGSSWTTCTGGPTSWSCTVSVAVEDADEITVYAAGGDYAP